MNRRMIRVISKGGSFIGLLWLAYSGTPLEKAIAGYITDAAMEDGGPGIGQSSSRRTSWPSRRQLCRGRFGQRIDAGIAIGNKKRYNTAESSAICEEAETEACYA